MHPAFVIHRIEQHIQEARVRAGLTPFPPPFASWPDPSFVSESRISGRRGSRLGRVSARHPYPRRDPTRAERISVEGIHARYNPRKGSHQDEDQTVVVGHQTHRREYVHGCRACYIREYQFFLRHPELIPKNHPSPADRLGAWKAGGYVLGEHIGVIEGLPVHPKKKVR